MASASDKAAKIAAALGAKFAPAYSFKSGLTYGKIAFLDLEVWRNEPRLYVGSDIRSLAFYEGITAAGVQEVVTSIKQISTNDSRNKR